MMTKRSPMRSRHDFFRLDAGALISKDWKITGRRHPVVGNNESNENERNTQETKSHPAHRPAADSAGCSSPRATGGEPPVGVGADNAPGLGAFAGGGGREGDVSIKSTKGP